MDSLFFILLVRSSFISTFSRCELFENSALKSVLLRLSHKYFCIKNFLLFQSEYNKKIAKFHSRYFIHSVFAFSNEEKKENKTHTKTWHRRDVFTLSQILRVRDGINVRKKKFNTEIATITIERKNILFFCENPNENPFSNAEKSATKFVK